MQQAASLYLSEQFGRFLIVGGIALISNWLSRFAFNWFVGFGTAIVLAYLVGIAVAFVLNKIFVFPYSNRSLNYEMFFFAFFNIAAFPFVWSAAYALGEWIFVCWFPRQMALALGHGLAIALPVFVSFVLHKYVTFRDAAGPRAKGPKNA